MVIVHSGVAIRDVHGRERREQVYALVSQPSLTFNSETSRVGGDFYANAM